MANLPIQKIKICVPFQINADSIQNQVKLGGYFDVFRCKVLGNHELVCTERKAFVFLVLI